VGAGQGLADKIKTHRTYISKIENQELMPSDKLMGKIIKGLNSPTLLKIYLAEKRTEILRKSK
jgi:ribosome-binding protein aMBF1 (putative translation factor)